MSLRACSPPTLALGRWRRKVVVARRPVLGRDPVVRMLLGIRRWAHAHGYARDWMKVELIEVNYDPAMLVREGSHIDSVHVCSIEATRSPAFVSSATLTSWCTSLAS